MEDGPWQTGLDLKNITTQKSIVFPRVRSDKDDNGYFFRLKNVRKRLFKNRYHLLDISWGQRIMPNRVQCHRHEVGVRVPTHPLYKETEQLWHNFL